MRLTIKIENEYFSNVVPNEHHNAIKPCLNKLGQIEDILDKYNIVDLGELDVCLENEQKGTDYFEKWWDKRFKELIKPYKDIEKELGIDLITYIKLVQEGFYGFCRDEDHDKPYIFQFLPHDFVAFSDELVVYREDSDEVYTTYKYKDYGKTWSLTKEELE